MGFSDLLSSSRGPGVIGTMVAGVVLGGFGLLFFFVFDPGMQGKSDTMANDVRRNEEDIASSRREIASRQSLLEELPQRQADERDLTQLKAVNALALKNIADLESDREAAEKRVSDAAKEFEDYKNAYRESERAAAVGEVIPELKLNDGKVYTDATVKAVDAIGMQISYAGGLKRIDYKLLPDKLQDRFQFDEIQQSEAIGGENVIKNGNNKNADVAILEQRRANKVKELSDLKSRVDADAAYVKTFRASIPQRKAAIESYRNLIVAEQAKPVSKAPAMRPKLQEMEAAFAADTNTSVQKDQAVKDNKARIIPSLQSAIDDLDKQIASVRARPIQ